MRIIRIPFVFCLLLFSMAQASPITSPHEPQMEPSLDRQMNRSGFFTPPYFNGADLITDTPSNLTIYNNSGSSQTLTGLYIYGAFDDNLCSISYGGVTNPGDRANWINWSQSITIADQETLVVGQNYLYILIWQVAAAAISSDASQLFNDGGYRPGNFINGVRFLVKVTNATGISANSLFTPMNLNTTTQGCVRVSPSGAQICDDTTHRCSLTIARQITIDPP